MRVIHFVPSAFDYFADIKSVAFELVAGLSEAGVENEIIALQYGVLPQAEKDENQSVKTNYLGARYEGVINFHETLQDLSGFDVVHLHAPFLGAANEIIKWKKNNPEIPLVVTYYRDIPIVDLISVFLRWYNSRYLSKIFLIADRVICPILDNFLESRGKYLLEDLNKLEEFGTWNDDIHLTESANKVKLLQRDEVVKNLIGIYYTLINDK